MPPAGDSPSPAGALPAARPSRCPQSYGPFRYAERSLKEQTFTITPTTKVDRLCLLCMATAILSLHPGADTPQAQEVAPAIPRITFTKFLKGSTPEYVTLAIDANGKGTYDSAKSRNLQLRARFQISAGTTAQIFPWRIIGLLPLPRPRQLATKWPTWDSRRSLTSQANKPARLNTTTQKSRRPATHGNHGENWQR